MTSSCDFRNVAQYLGLHRPKSWHPGGIEYLDTDSQTVSDSTRSSSRDSISPPAAIVPGRRVKSLDDLREACKQRNGHVDIGIPTRIRHPYPVFDRTEATLPGLQQYCERCLGMSAESLAQPGGYKHSLFSELFESRIWCRLCQRLLSEMLLEEAMVDTPDRYQIILSLEDTGDGVEARAFSTHRRRPPSLTGHGHKRAHYEDNFSQIRLEIIELRSRKVQEDSMKLLPCCVAQTSPTDLAPDESKLRSAGGRTLFCLTEEHDPATEFGVEYVRQIGSGTSSSRSFEIAAGWLASCLSSEHPPKLGHWKSSSHKYGNPIVRGGPAYRRPPKYSFPESRLGHKAGGSSAIGPEIEAKLAQDPLRLVEIQQDTEGSGTTVRVIHTDGRRYPYAALSYCWGKAQPGDDRPWQTTSETLQSHLKGIKSQYLPQTLQDALVICERLHISYLWVDSLCIIQDSQSEWAAEAAKMSGIYLGSLLTISMSASVSSESGCFNHVSQRLVESGQFQTDWLTIGTKLRDGRSSSLHITDYFSESSLFDDEVQRGVLGRRAWALQEHIMPQRTLYVTSKQLLWECKHCRLSEDNFPQRQDDRLYPICDYDFPLDTTAIIEMWYKRVIEDYTRRQLTYEKDRLIAISALARATYLNRHIGYVAGLWRDCIVPGLLWKRSGPGGKSKTYSCPTWSWASQNSAVRYRYATPSPATPEPSESFPRVQNVSWETKPENPFGDVLFAHVDLNTTIALGRVLRDGAFHAAKFKTIAQGESQTLIIPECSLIITLCASAVMDDADGGSQDVVVANMGHCLLLLEPPSLSSTEYRRIGIAFTEYWDFKDDRCLSMDKLLRGWTQRTIRLV